MNYRQINYNVMCDTAEQCEVQPALQQAIQTSIQKQYVVTHGTKIPVGTSEPKETRIIVTGHRTFQAAKQYAGKHVAVLNFANNHSIGGAPYSAGAQEESLCRCSTLLPCLKACKRTFYQPHVDDYCSHRMNAMGNDDLIYTPGVVVFKSDVSEPQMLPTEQWYSVDVITSAAPQCSATSKLPDTYPFIIRSRLKQVLDVAAKEGVEVLILGAWGCGAFHNPPSIVAQVFRQLLQQYHCFDTVEFAIGSCYTPNFDVFEQAFQR